MIKMCPHIFTQLAKQGVSSQKHDAAVGVVILNCLFAVLMVMSSNTKLFCIHND